VISQKNMKDNTSVIRTMSMHIYRIITNVHHIMHGNVINL